MVFKLLQANYDVFKYSRVYFVVISNTDSRVMLFFFKRVDGPRAVNVGPFLWTSYDSFGTFDMSMK